MSSGDGRIMRKVYLDNGSTSFPKAPGVGEAMSKFITEVGCNVSRGGYETAYILEKPYLKPDRCCAACSISRMRNTWYLRQALHTA